MSLPANISKRFVYEPLNFPGQSIRVVTLYQGSFSDPIRISLAEIQLVPNYFQRHHGLFQYEALSYVWGSEHNPKDAIMPDRSSISITNNLDIALRHLRYTAEDRQLWVDSLCINQKDEEEKSSQIPLMGSIYRLANRVLAWLGPEENESRHALETIAHVGRQVEINWSTTSIRPARGTSELGWAELAMTAPFNDQELHSICSLFERPWFERIWVRQEIILSTVALVKCGSTEVDWNLFRKGAYVMFRQSSDIWHIWERNIAFIQSLRLVESLCRTRPGFLGYRDLRTDIRGTKSKDPRDMIYGVSSLLCGPDQGLGIQADYSKSVSEVYTDVVQRIIIQRRSLKILDTCELCSKVLDIPSWVPDWSSSLKQLNMPWGTWSACGWISAKVNFPQDTFLGKRVLRVAGIRASRIANVRCAQTGNYDTEVSHNRMIKLIRHFKPSGDLDAPYKSGGTIIEAYARVFVGLGFAHDFDPPDRYWPEFDRTVQDVRNIWMTDGNYDELRKVSMHPSKAFFRTFTLNIVGRCIFSTVDGLIGLAPLGTISNDLVCVIFGCRHPVILREYATSSASNAMYQVVGVCYVPGLMMGEIIHGSFPSFCRPINKFGHSLSTPAIENTHVALLDTRRNELKTDPSAILMEMGIRCERYQRHPHILEVTQEALQEANIAIEDFNLF
ncbi:hypothetical protein NW756_006417 [Fusarium oxysporum]|nr:hypothetical protein NW763_009085 [Fusarium oxysporum]KAJ4090074.1 hypothetical protein NW756_006417 [Fusarium oxysporum]